MKKLTTIILAVIYTVNLMAQVPSYVPTNGLVGWWPFTGNTIDSSGNGNNGTVNGATLTSDRFGNTAKAYEFNGLNQFISVTSAVKMLPSNITLSVWFKIDADGAYSGNNFLGPLIRSRFYGYVVWYDSLTSSIQVITHHDNNGQILGSDTRTPSGINDNFWHLLTTSFNGSVSNLYLDGILVDSDSISGNLYYASDGIIAFGRDGNNPSPFTAHYAGKLDDIGIWNRALCQAEITALYTGFVKSLAITPIINAKNIGSNATFTATTTASNSSYIWQSNFGQGFQTLNNVGQYSGTSTNAMSISNLQLSNHMEPIRAISTSGTCKDTSNIAYVKILDTCITKINDTVKITKYDTVKVTSYDTIKVTKYDTIKVTDTLVINATLSGVSAPNNTNRLIIYPNPAKDHITIDYGTFSRMNGYTLKIVNTLGQIVFSTPINQQTSYINLSTWTGKGMYYVQIYDASNTLTENRKIVLQ